MSWMSVASLGLGRCEWTAKLTRSDVFRIARYLSHYCSLQWFNAGGLAGWLVAFGMWFIETKD